MNDTTIWRTCKRCKRDFRLVTTQGRPRQVCYECKPSRVSRVQHNTKPSGQRPPTGGQNHESAGQTRPQPTAVGSDLGSSTNAPHCAWCGAYTPHGQPFCNPQHRQAFAKKVADAKRGEPAPLSEPQKGRPTGTRGISPYERPLERVRRQQRELESQQRAENQTKRAGQPPRNAGARPDPPTQQSNGIPAAVAYPVDPPTVTQGLVTSDIGEK